MIFNIYTVWDECTKAYLQPMFFVSKGQAIRALTSAVNDPEHDFHKYSDQYVLFELGSYDNANAVFELYNAPRSVGVCSEFKSVSDGARTPS